MRGLRKTWPPSNVRPEGQEACSFTDAEQAYLDELARRPVEDRTHCARTHFNDLDKAKLREVMLRDQRYLCVYCERPLTSSPTPRIDHWRPLRLNHRLALHWKNLYLSCATPETCDIAKGGRALRWADTDPDLPWPIDFDFERYVGFTSGGKMYVRNDVTMDDATRRALAVAIDEQKDGTRTIPAVVRLNDPALVAARAAAIDSERTRLQRRFRDTTASRGEREEIASEMLVAERLPDFVSIRVAWLRKMLGTGR